ncbi:hypothetical protein ACFKJC_00020, partial [Streptococcus agalactiae]
MVRLLNFNIKFSTILACSAILLAWLYQNKSVTEPFLLKKLAIYFIFFIATLIGNFKNESSILETPLLFISIFFMKRHFETTRRIVIKVGTSSLVQTSGKINLSKIDHL